MAVAEAATDEPNIWGWLWIWGLVFAGLVTPCIGYWTLPPPRAALTPAEHVGPLSLRLEEVRDFWGSRRSGSYRTQRIVLAIPGGPVVTASPPPMLWVDGTDHIRFGETTRFLIDPARKLIYEAALGDKVLLSYDESADSLRRRGRGLMLGGLIMLALGGFHVARHFWWPAR